MNPCRVERTTKTVIERKLLVALEENKNQVAILATKQDLEDMIEALRGYVTGDHQKDFRRVLLAEGMEQLLRVAFP